MKIKVEENWQEYRTAITQGCQSFTIYEGTKDRCKWFAQQFRKALKNHDAEVWGKVTGLLKPPAVHNR